MWYYQGLDLKKNSNDHKTELMGKGVETRKLTDQKRLGTEEGKG